MSTLTVSVVQQPLAWMDSKKNLAHFTQLLKSILPSDLIVLPEMFTTGFAMQAADLAHPECELFYWMHYQAETTQAMVVGSVAVSTGRGPVNRLMMVTPNGEVYRYDKKHLFRMGNEHQYFVAGQARCIVNWKGFRILPLICYDLRFPVFSRNRQDYDLALYLANWPENRRLHWQTLLRARGIENQVFVIGCNRVGYDGNQLYYSGDSQIISAEGDILAGQGQGIATVLSAKLSLHQLQDYRRRFPAWQDADDFSF